MRYVQDHGDARIPRSLTVDGYKVAAWVSTQRNKYAEGSLDADRQRRLRNLPGWTWDPFVDQWEDGFRRLLQYVKDHGDARVSRDYTVDGYPLGEWVKVQRGSHAKGTLDGDREHRLESLRGWTWDPRSARWDEGFNRLLEYVDETGHARVPVSYKAGDYHLGAWVKTQRKQHARGDLDADRQCQLQNLPGWRWMASSST